MSRVKKLRRTIAASAISNKKVMLAAIDKCLAHQAHKPSAVLAESLLTFGARRAGKASAFDAATETEFRLYARMAICLTGYIAFPPLTDVAKDLAKSFKDSRYADVAYAKQQFNKYRPIATAIQSMSPVSIMDIEDFKTKTSMSENLVSDRIVKAATVGIDAIRESIKQIESNSAATDKLVERWFGEGAHNELLANFRRLLARSDDLMNPVFIEYEKDNVWGSSFEGSRSIKLAEKFFKDEYTKPASKLGSEYIAYDKEITRAKKVSTKYFELNRKQTSLNKIMGTMEGMFAYDNDKQTLQERVEEFAEEAKSSGASEVRTMTKDEYVNMLLKDLEYFGFDRKESVSAAKRKKLAAETKYANEKKALADSQGDLSLMEVTAFGTYVHELTHMVLGTDDTDSAVIGVPGMKVYGPLLCQMLAAKNKDLALNNADNYRHFVECWISE